MKALIVCLSIAGVCFAFWFVVMFGFFRLRAWLHPDWLSSRLRRSQAALALYREFADKGWDVSLATHYAENLTSWRGQIIAGSTDGFMFAMLDLSLDELESSLVTVKERNEFKVRLK